MEIKDIDRRVRADGGLSLAFTTSPSEEEAEHYPEYPDWIMKLLPLFITHIDRPVYAVQNLPPEMTAAMIARYSRTNKGMVDLIVDILTDVYEAEIKEGDDEKLNNIVNGLTEVMRLQSSTKIQNFHAKYTLQGHESIKKLSNGITVAVDQCSMLAASNVMSRRLGVQFMERSTRFQKNFFTKPEYMQNIFEDQGINMRYEALMRVAFATGQQVFDEVSDYLHRAYPWKLTNTMKTYGITEQKWNHWIRNRALDAARYCIPVSAVTGFAVTGNAMGYNSIIKNLASCPSPDFIALAGLVREAAAAVSPLLIDEEAKADYHRKRMYTVDDPDLYKIRKHIMDRLSDDAKAMLGQPQSDIDVCRLALDYKHMNGDDYIRYMTSMLIARSIAMPIDVVYDYISSEKFKKTPPPEMNTFIDAKNSPPVSSTDWCLRVLAKYMGTYSEEGNQLMSMRTTLLKPFLDREAPDGDMQIKDVDKTMPLMRLFEMVDLTFDVTISFGSWRDMNRHALLSQWEWPLVPNLGYAVPSEYKHFSEELKDQYQSLFAMSSQLWEEAKKNYGTFMAQYAGLFMWNQRRLIRANIRELDYIMTLRSKWAGHAEYRMLAQLIYKTIYKLWPSAANRFLDVDRRDYLFGPVTTEFMKQSGIADG